jgi:hypothetical protein
MEKRRRQRGRTIKRKAEKERRKEGRRQRGSPNQERISVE